MKIIGLTGLARSGKDTACGFILEWAAANDVFAGRYSFAEKLKVSAARALGYDGDDAVGFCESLKHDGELAFTFDGETTAGKISGREYLQRYGTEAHRDVFGDNFWVRALFAELDDADFDIGVELAVITDCRFPNEAKAINNSRGGGEVWEVVRDAAGLGDGLEAHASEAGLGVEKITLSLDNNGSIDDFRALVFEACEVFLKAWVT